MGCIYYENELTTVKLSNDKILKFEEYGDMVELHSLLTEHLLKKDENWKNITKLEKIDLDDFLKIVPSRVLDEVSIRNISDLKNIYEKGYIQAIKDIFNSIRK